ncbi:TetR/AcrR family transcriptional regulator [Clostridium guangxiense]|uniref:TetR/AcrR family transcriptional regulator n=1 Tax=Clostridium guangxiense TaxID=1662055 RepID=UPI001E4D499B|nr:TetR/AcrR family transcriptional regulator [Clostridium guangxiense]MCD2348754.1 TetR/AcrR family transcriptional regulator [Clostridium guangxiense]
MNTISRREREKQTREEAIINAAEKIFIEKSYSEASMEAIAKECEFTRKTLYQYFANKEDLYYTVVIRGFTRLLDYFQKEIKNGNTGFKKLENLGFAYYKFYKDFPGTLNLMNYIGYVKSKKENMYKREEFNKITDLVAQTIAKIIDEGKSDGSIRTDIDTMSATLSSEFLTTGFFNMLSVSGNTFMSHFSLNEDDFIHFNMTLLSGIFRNKK